MRSTSAGMKVRRDWRARRAVEGSSVRSERSLSQAECGLRWGKYCRASSVRPKTRTDEEGVFCIRLSVCRVGMKHGAKLQNIPQMAKEIRE